jgi:N-acetylglucosamine kinase-like BadF-type ATPase
MGYLLGIDGGGTRTTACVADDHLSIISRAQTGPSNPIKAGATSAQRELARACRQALRKARIRTAKLDAVCAGLAGVESTSIQQPVLSWLRKAFPACTLIVTTDAAIALAAAFGENEGAVVIAGSGSIAYGRNQHGSILRVGGWGSIYDDAGSGYDIGRKAIAAALRAYDGRGRPTRLAESLCHTFCLRKIVDVIAKPLTAQEIAALFPLVQHHAIEGDAVARSLCRGAAADLAELALTMILRLRRQRGPVRIVCSGGIFQSSPMIRRAFAMQVHQSAPRARISLLQREPVEGALLLARKSVQSRTNKQNSS